jgi:hypothetical protein
MEICTVFQNVDAYAGDPILSLMETFKDPALPLADRAKPDVAAPANALPRRPPPAAEE